MSGHRKGPAKLDAAAPAAPRFDAARAGSTPERKLQLRADPRERHVASRRRGPGTGLIIALLLLVGASFVYLQLQGFFEERELRSLGRSLGVESWLLSVGLVTDAPPADSDLSMSELTEIERLLDQLAFGPGATDGVIDQDSAAAIRNFQDLAGTPADGVPSRKLLEELRVLVALQTRSPRR